MPKTRTISGIFFSPALFVLFWCTLFIWQSSYIAIDGSRIFCLFDDSLISLRYSWNLAHGEGLVWNPGERVEGFTSPLWVLVLSLPALFLDKGQLVLSVQILGVFLLLGMGWFSTRLSQTLFQDCPEKRGLGTAAFLLPLIYYPISYLTLAGMETGLLALLVLAALDRAFRRPYSGQPDPVLAGLLGLSYLTRPDAAIFIGGLLLFRSLSVLRNHSSWVGLGLEFAVAGAFVAGIQVFRWVYFGTLVPNTYLVKVAGIPLGLRLPNGMSYLIPLLPPLAIPILLAAVGVIRGRSAGEWLILGLVLGYLTYTVWVGGDITHFPRFAAPVLLPLILVSARSALGLAGKRDPRPVLSPALLILLTLLAGAPFLPDLVFARTINNQEFNERNTNTALVLNQILRPEAKVGVNSAGAIPYWTGLQGVDFYGKCDPVIARLKPTFAYLPNGKIRPYLPGHVRFDVVHSFLNLKPDYAQAFPNYNEASRELDAAVIRKYRWLSYPGIGPKDGLNLRRGSPNIDWKAIDRIVMSRYRTRFEPPFIETWLYD